LIRILKITLFFLLATNFSVSTYAADSIPPVILQRLQGEIVFDGIPDESAWQQAESFPFVTHSPVFGKKPEERTEVRVLYDEDYVYIGGWLYTEDPSRILSTSKLRDELKGDCDWLGVVVDSYNDNENGMSFWTTPDGLRTDMEVFNDATGTPVIEPINLSWNTHWEVKTQVNEEGWFVEMLIPVSSLRFQEEGGKVTMGLILIRWIPQHNSIYIYPGIPNEFGPFSAWKVSMAQDVVFLGLEPRRPLYITPYALAGFSQVNELNEAETNYEFSRDKKLDVGLDLKYGITSNLTLDVTLNTDFAQVEEDDEKVNLTRYDLFFEEKRQFFLERASIFDFNTSGPNTMFYSRRIGLDGDYNLVPIIGGIRLIGRKNGWDLGFMDMQTARSDSLPSENFGVLRLKKRVLNQNSYVGGIYTSRLGLDGSFNQVYGLDALVRVTGYEYLKLVWGQSFENDFTNKPLVLDNARYLVNWQRRRKVGFHYNLTMSGTGPAYNPGIGFQNRDDYHAYGGILNYTWLMPEKSRIIQHGPELMGFDRISQSRGTRESTFLAINYVIEMKSLWQGNVGVNWNYENLYELFEISDDVNIPIGEYSFPQLKGLIMTPMSKPVWMMLQFEGGGYYDGKMLSVTTMPNWSISSSLILSGAYIYSNVVLVTRGQHFISHIGRIKAMLMFSTKLSLSAFLQYNSENHLVSSNIRFRYNPREGNDLWIVYNEGTNTDLDRDIPKSPRLAGRTVMLKYTYTFRL
jgi:hypothetical protein